MSNPIMRFFKFDHLPEHLQKVSKPIGQLAEQMDKELPDGPEKSAGLRKLLEAKDCLVRAALALLVLIMITGCGEPRQPSITIWEADHEYADLVSASAVVDGMQVRIYRDAIPMLTHDGAGFALVPRQYTLLVEHGRVVSEERLGALMP